MEVVTYDSVSRAIAIRLEDNSTLSTYFSKQSDLTEGFQRTYVKVTDQAGKQRRRVVDSLGRTIRVDEPTGDGSLGAIDEYDGNGNVSKITQSDGSVIQERLFRYDRLSRLTHEKQVEATPTLNDNGELGGTAWTKVLKYDSYGRLAESTDARGVKTTFAEFDPLNRLKRVTFSDGTPQVTYTYDQARTGVFNIGFVTRIETAAGDPVLRPNTPATSTEFDYDQMGRVVKHRQGVDSQVYALEYAYNLAGQPTTMKYPSGRVVSTDYDANGRLAQIQDTARTYLGGLQYSLDVSGSLQRLHEYQ
jgi:YD repeat-containing protein